MTTGGMATAAALAGGIGEFGGPEAVQIDAFEADAALPLPPVPSRGVSGPQGGRPPGARNRTTQQFADYFLSRYRSPVVAMAEVYSRSAEDLARALFLTRVVRELAPGQQQIKAVCDADGNTTGYLVWDLERAFEKQQAAMVAAAPYVNKKQPIAIDTQGKVAGVLVIGEMAGVTDGGDGVLTLDITPHHIEQNQQVSGDGDVRLVGDQSHDDGNTLKPFGDCQNDH